MTRHQGPALYYLLSDVLHLSDLTVQLQFAARHVPSD